MTERLTEAQIAAIRDARQRFETWRNDDRGCDVLIPIACDMADAIGFLDTELAAARQQIATLTAERDHIQRSYEQACTNLATLMKRVAAAEAQIATLTAERGEAERLALGVFERWRQDLDADAFTHDDGVRFQQMLHDTFTARARHD